MAKDCKLLKISIFVKGFVAEAWVYAFIAKATNVAIVMNDTKSKASVKADMCSCLSSIEPPLSRLTRDWR